MKPLLPLLLLSAGPLLAEPVMVRESVILKAERAAVSIKAGTEVELISREADTATIKYRNVTGKIPASKLEGATGPAAAPLPAEAKPGAGQVSVGQPRPATAGTNPGPVATGNGAPASSARPPQTTYGKAVEKARVNATAHDKNVVKPTDEILKE